MGRRFLVRAYQSKKSTGTDHRVAYLVPMISDITLGLAFTFIFIALGVVAFTYLVKGKM